MTTPRGYAVAHLTSVDAGPAIVAYLAAIDATLEPHGGRFVVHGGDPEVLEGRWTGDLVVIEFPDRERARAWYDSEAYRRIIGLRTEHSRGSVVLVDGVVSPHHATDVLPAALRPARA